MSELWDEWDVGVFDAGRSPDEIAAWAARADPWDGIQTPLGKLDPTLLSRRGRVDALIALERLKAWADAQQHRLLASLASQPLPSVDPTDPLPEVAAELDKQWVREEVACALRIAAPTAAARLRNAVALTDRLPETLAALHGGRISAAMARRLAEDTAALDVATAAAVQRRVLARAGQQTFSQFAQSLKRALHALDPRGQEEQHEAAARNRRVGLQPLEHGMAELTALLRADEATAAWAAIDHAARCCTGNPANPPDGSKPDERTMDERRADALVALLHGETSEAAGGPAVQVTVALSTLLGLDHQPGELAGYGPIPATLARQIAAEPTGTWRRLLTDDHGQLLDFGRRTYRPPAALADHVRARDRTCRFPTCNRRAERCDLDHSVPWHAGGSTSEANLHAVCPRQHQLKHQAGWRTVRHGDGATEWISPTGHRYLKPPETLPVDTTLRAPTDRPPPQNCDPPPF